MSKSVKIYTYLRYFLGTVCSIRQEFLDVPLSQEDNQLSPWPATFFRLFPASGPCLVLPLLQVTSRACSLRSLKEHFPLGHFNGSFLQVNEVSFPCGRLKDISPPHVTSRAMSLSHLKGIIHQVISGALSLR